MPVSAPQRSRFSHRIRRPCDLMRRRLFTSLSAVSLVLCIGATTSWCRSYFDQDGLLVLKIPNGVQIRHDRGSVNLNFTKNMLDSVEPERLHLVYIKSPICSHPNWMPRFMGFGFKGRTRLEVAWSVVAPHWFLVLITLILPLAWGTRFSRRRLQAKKHFCINCGYDLRGSKFRCPECGTPIASSHS